jgi:hypothetical protein
MHCKSMEAQETRAMLTARKLVQKELLETESSLRRILRCHRRSASNRAPPLARTLPLSPL